MLILGIDPGVNNIGLAIVDYDLTTKTYSFIEGYHYEDSKSNISYLDYQGFLSDLFLRNVTILQEYKIKSNFSKVIIEKPFFSFNTYAKNVKTLEFIGVSKLVSNQFRVDIVEYAPATIKKHVTGNGRATKTDIINSINTLYNISLENNHIADATACATTYLKLHYD